MAEPLVDWMSPDVVVDEPHYRYAVSGTGLHDATVARLP